MQTVSRYLRKLIILCFVSLKSELFLNNKNPMPFGTKYPQFSFQLAVDDDEVHSIQSATGRRTSIERQWWICHLEAVIEISRLNIPRKIDTWLIHLLTQSVSQKETFANSHIDVTHIHVYMYTYIYIEYIYIYNIYIEYIYVYIYICRWYCFLLFLFPRSSSQSPRFFSHEFFPQKKIGCQSWGDYRDVQAAVLHFFRVETFDWKLWKHQVVSHEETHSVFFRFNENQLFFLKYL